MLDYEEIKEFFAKKLADDFKGKGRFESAFYHTIVYAYGRGLSDGAEGTGVGGRGVVHYGGGQMTDYEGIRDG